MKELKLTKEEAELLQSVLMYVYDQRHDIVQRNNKILTGKERVELLSLSNMYWDLADKIRRL